MIYMTQNLPNIEPDPLMYFNVKRVYYPPDYFEYLTIEGQRYNLEKTIEEWIQKNTRGRYYIDWVKILTDDNQFKQGIKIGFENHKELSYFSLACPYLKY